MGEPHSEKTGFARRDIVEWDEQRWVGDDGKERVTAAGRGVVTVPNDGGFVWAENEHQSVILEWEKFRRVTLGD